MFNKIEFYLFFLFIIIYSCKFKGNDYHICNNIFKDIEFEDDLSRELKTNSWIKIHELVFNYNDTQFEERRITVLYRDTVKNEIKMASKYVKLDFYDNVVKAQYIGDTLFKLSINNDAVVNYLLRFELDTQKRVIKQVYYRLRNNNKTDYDSLSIEKINEYFFNSNCKVVRIKNYYINSKDTIYEEFNYEGKNLVSVTRMGENIGFFSDKYYYNLQDSLQRIEKYRNGLLWSRRFINCKNLSVDSVLFYSESGVVNRKDIYEYPPPVSSMSNQ